MHIMNKKLTYEYRNIDISGILSTQTCKQQLLSSKQTKNKTTFSNEILSSRNKDPEFDVFHLAPSLSPNSYVSRWNFLKKKTEPGAHQYDKIKCFLQNSLSWLEKSLTSVLSHSHDAI